MTHTVKGNKEILLENTNLNILGTYEKSEEFIEIEKETTNKTSEEMMAAIPEIMKEKELGKIYEIQGNGYTLTIRPTNSPNLPNTTQVEFDECEQIIRKEYNISNTSIITFLQLEIHNEDDNAYIIESNILFMMIN